MFDSGAYTIFDHPFKKMHTEFQLTFLTFRASSYIKYSNNTMKSNTNCIALLHYSFNINLIKSKPKPATNSIQPNNSIVVLPFSWFQAYNVSSTTQKSLFRFAETTQLSNIWTNICKFIILLYFRHCLHSSLRLQNLWFINNSPHLIVKFLVN